MMIFTNKAFANPLSSFLLPFLFMLRLRAHQSLAWLRTANCRTGESLEDIHIFDHRWWYSRSFLEGSAGSL